jgi:uncharacterized protein YfaS (alpha-2-macroglobulin family)
MIRILIQLTLILDRVEDPVIALHLYSINKKRSNMKSQTNVALLILAILSVTIMSCDQTLTSSNKEIKTEFNDFIRGYTAGVIKSDQAVEVHFVDLENLTNVDPSKMISFSPNIKGQATWADSRTLVFHPEEKWRSGQNYQASVKLKYIKGLDRNQPDFDFSFDIVNKSYQLRDVRLRNEQDQDLNTHQLTGELQFSDAVDVNKIEKAVRIFNKHNGYTIKWQHHMGENRHLFLVHGITRENEPYDVTIKIDAAALGMKLDAERTIQIPQKGIFQYITHRVNNGSQQSIEIDFSDPLDPNQETDGLISFDKDVPARYLIQDNQLIIFPSTRQVGSLTMNIFDHIQNIKKIKLSKPLKKNVIFYDEKPQVSLLKKGVIVPRSEGLKFPFKAVNVRAVRLKIVHILEDNVAFFLQRSELGGTDDIKRAGRLIYNDILHLKTDQSVDFRSWNTYSFNLEQHVDVEPGAVYRVILSLEKEYSLYPCEGDTARTDEIETTKSWDPKINESDRNLYNSYEPYYYYWDDEDRVLGNPCADDYFTPYNTTVSQSIVASDLGIIAKQGSGNTLHVVVSDILSSEAKAGVQVNIYTYQHTLIGSGTTDPDGFAHIEVQGQPFLLIARLGVDYGYLRLDDGAVESVSMFQVEGQKNEAQLKGFIYGERGVWRPGDSIYLQFILQDRGKQIPDDHPIIFEWYNPRDQLIHFSAQTIGNQNIHDFRLNTNSSDPTGPWRAVIKIGNSRFEKTIRVETVKPNRLKMDIDFGSDIVQMTGDSIQGLFNSKWLHGANASNLKADVKMKLGSGNTSFIGFTGFRFDDASKSFQQSEKEIFSGKLNEKGEALISAKMNEKNAPGMLSAQFTSRVFEQGGEFSIDRKSVKISPYAAYVGIKIPDGSGWNGALKPEDSKIATLALLDSDGKPLNGQVEIKIYGLSWRWWYDNNGGESLANFMRSKESQLIVSKVVEIKNGQALYDLPELDYYGNYILIAHDGKSGHSASHQFRYYWNRTDINDKESSKMLQFSLAKETYQIDETIEINIPSNGQGHFIVSLENANDVVQLKRVKANNNTTKVTFYADRALVPNAYVYVAYIQPHAQTANDLPIRMFGVQPVFIEDKSTHLFPTISMADSWEPEQEVEIEIAEQEGKSMEYTLAIVDEGLLQLTRFKTPDPWSALHQKEALSVRTWDLYDDVIGAHAGEMAGLLAIGGDGTVIEVGGVKANRFPPMVKFLGPFKLKKGKKNKHKIMLPNYIGQVRAMVVASTDRAYGQAEKSVTVKKPLMVLASLPRVVGPGETISLPVTTFAMEDNIKNVSVSVQAGPLFQNINQSQNIQFNQTGDQVSYFPIKVANKVGQERITVTAEGHGQRASYEIEIDVRPSNPPIHLSQSVVIEPGESKTIDFNLPGIDGTNTLSLEVANGLQVDLGAKAERLFGYPHGCIEQTTSRAFPQLYMSKIMTISEEKQQEIDKNIKGGIDRLYSFQLRNGGLGYWPNANTASPWGTTYAGHFMLEAQAMGFTLPLGFLDNWINYQKSIANNWLPQNYGINDHGYAWSHELMQAYRLYTLALADAPQIGAMNRLRGQENLSLQATWRLALTYYLIGREDVAADLIANADLNVKEYKNYGETFGSSARDRAMILETLVKMKKWDKALLVAEKMMEQWKANAWYSTQSTAYVLMSLFKFADDQKDGDLIMEYALDGNQNTSVRDKNNLFYQELNVPDGMSHQISLTNKGDKRLYAKVNTSGIPMEGKEESQSSNLDMAVTYTYTAGVPIDPQKLTRGTDFLATVTIKNPGVLGDYNEMALTQIFPSGWEIHNTRLDLMQDDKKMDVPIYQDIRDDRVYTYFNIPSGKTRTYQLHLTATFPGTYYMPSIYCEAMYDKNVYALEAGRWVEIVDGN